MKLPLRARITAWYFGVLIVTFASFAWLTDYGFRHSIETTVDDASRANLESIQKVIERTSPRGPTEIKEELEELAGLWAGAGLIEVADGSHHLIIQSPAFQHPFLGLPAPAGHKITYFTDNLEDVQYRIAAQIIEVGGFTFYIRAAVPTEPFDQALDRFRLILQWTLPALVIIASLAGYWLSRRALSPVNEIIETARSIGIQSLSRRLTVPEPHDELRRLTETLNDMLGRIESSVKRITQFTADASHDLRTPVALIRTSAELALRRSRSEQEYRETLARILATSEETTGLIENLLTLARADAHATDIEFQPTALAPYLERALDQTRVLAYAKDIRISEDVSASTPLVMANGGALERLFLMLLENAVKYTEKGGSIHVHCNGGPEKALVEIRDTGIGISEKDLPHIFERFYRADQARSREPGGAGLGLAIARWIVDIHGGSIEASSQPGQGTTVQVSLPPVTTN